MAQNARAAWLAMATVTSRSGLRATMPRFDPNSAAARAYRKRGKHGPAAKRIVIGLVERGGEVRPRFSNRGIGERKVNR